jgi:iron only hydrogenase large subunit-like protein/uncharacterized Fe-S cluster-containing protein
MAEMLQHPRQVVFTLSARCRDCYRCLRVCPVKAIRMREGQAYVDERLCLGCGTCIRECPQGAKTYRMDIDLAQDLLELKVPVAASVAPSYAAVYTPWQRSRLASALRALGFAEVHETARGAGEVASATIQAAQASGARAQVCTACPAVVHYVERYRPELAGTLVQVVSPMIAHAKYLKARLGQHARVVFIGPCVAKKIEAQRPEYKGLVEVVLTFQELEEWFARRGVVLANCEESGFDGDALAEARFFALPGGLLKAAHLDHGGMHRELTHVSGPQEVKEALDEVARRGSGEAFSLVEPLFCSQGCINGPGVPSGTNVFERKGKLLEYVHSRSFSAAEAPAVTEGALTMPQLRAQYAAAPEALREVAPEEIAQVLARTGKYAAEDELNCGACGYATCREKAQAVVRGMAEVSMCMPYMRRLAERRTDRIIETSPNGIVTLDEGLHIMSMNPSFRRFFVCSDALIGKHVSCLMDPAPFEKLAAGTVDQLEETVRHASYNLVCHQQMYAMRDDRHFVGIFVDVTKYQNNQAQLAKLKEETQAQAKDLLRHQIGMAQKLAQFLGESTARSEELINKLISQQEKQ